jgi:hypothetical protein
MDDNPYRSPNAAPEIDRQELLPLWRRVISSLLILFGAMYGFAGTMALVSVAATGGRLVDFIAATAGFGLGVAALWSGLRLRRRRSAD